MQKLFWAVSLGLAVLLPWVSPAPAEAPKLLKPINLTVNTAADEDDPHVGPNNLQLFYVSNAQKRFHLMVSERRAVARSAHPAEERLDRCGTFHKADVIVAETGDRVGVSGFE